ncbi:carbohydrate ABC transporter permease [Marinitenerispora sediminis]|uniref:Sugar ABC transporter permease n=1 Tax=Marinitenerispora sediminis TaxID=1931232 RepID=A0A368T0G7_9ACTN|nr:sugar ABC transporter permease [Marinitenerispora sediminis]RCV49578.1 sugar ABC transporter permease [Marinitenerispora sediminis]RCV52686.1 sugar ABC transporter permease [Marinitenerispora sediminis]RCV53140.1 sugar ABC transporter permease [Marinitenerispora sediminis]
MLDRPAVAFWVFAGPFTAGLALFTVVPVLWSVYLSFFDARNTVAPTTFVGLRNYTDMLTSPAFLDSLLTFTVFAACTVPLMFAGSLALALLLHRARWAQPVLRSVYFLPAACSYVAASLIWKLSIFNGVRFGLANTVLGWFGAEPVAWLSVTDPPWYWLALVTVRLWLQVGFYMLIFLAGLQRVPRELYEAAWVDGAATGWSTFRHITLPQLHATSAAVLLLNLVAAYQAFDEFYNLLGTDGYYPPYARPPLVYLYFTALGAGQDFGRGSAGAVILALLIALATMAQGRFLGFGRSRA